MYRVSQIKIGIREDEKALIEKICKKYKINREEIKSYNIVRKSVDARNKKNITFVYTVDINCTRKLSLPRAEQKYYKFPTSVLSQDIRPVVIGFGPAGMFAALILAQSGYKPIVIERGKDVKRRKADVEQFWKTGILNEESNVQFGEGGAGTFSDGKLTTGIKDERIFKVLSEFYNHGAKEDILYKQKPHIGTDMLVGIVESIRKEIISLGGEIRFDSKVVGFNTIKTCEEGDGQRVLKSVKIRENGKTYDLNCEKCILAIGHSARDTFYQLYEDGVLMTQKQISMGVRVEHPQKLINEAQYGDDELARILGAAEYKLSARTESGRGVYTFCMCPGGEVVMSASERGCTVSNGMSNSKRDGKCANSAVLVDVYTDDYGSTHPLAGFEFQRKYERKAFELSGGYALLSCRYQDFEKSKLYEALPEFVSRGIVDGMKNFGRKIRGFDGDEATFKGIESRSSSPVRILRSSNFESNIVGLYPAGEGPGYAGGIMSAAIDGIKVAESVIEMR